MAGERRINWGADATDAKYRTGDDDANSRFIVAEDLDGETVLLQWDETANEWVYGGSMDLSGSDINDGSTTVYDAATDTVGDGTTSADHASLDTGDLYNNVGTASAQTRWDGLVVPVAQGLGVSDAVDPASTTTPVRDAVTVASGGYGGTGVVELPPEQVIEDGTVSLPTGVGIRGLGVKRGEDGGVSELRTGVTGADAILIDGAAENGNNEITDILIHGQGPGSAAADAIKVTGGPTANLDFGTVHVEGWYGSALSTDGGAGTDGDIFQSDFGTFRVWDTDAGDTDALFKFYDGGPSNTFDLIAAYPTDASSASDSTIIYNTSAGLNINAMNIGGTAGPILDTAFGAKAVFRLNGYNYEPFGQNAAAPFLFKVDGWNNYVGPGRVSTGNVDYVFETTTSARDSELHKPALNITLNQAVVNVTANPAGTIVYHGSADEVDNTSGSVLGNPIHCLEDGVFKVSTGTGYDGGTYDTKYGP